MPTDRLLKLAHCWALTPFFAHPSSPACSTWVRESRWGEHQDWHLASELQAAQDTGTAAGGGTGAKRAPAKRGQQQPSIAALLQGRGATLPGS